MESNRIRELYLNFFKKKDHTVVPSSSLIPFDDPTLFFTSAGMVQFKRYWATDIPLPYKRATSCQKILRAGGKDSDIEKVGISGRHHTFFEMLGNFSFGDYFKKETIEWAYEFVVEVLKISPDILWVSYYEKDNETKQIWEKFLPEERIVPLGEKDNFWGPAGDTGVCGPCTELYVDFGVEKSCGRKNCKPGCDCERFLEFWNLVFPQYDKQLDGSLPLLKRKGVDTGMGLERMARILQGTPSNYETDLFYPIIKKIEEISAHSYEEQDKIPSFRIISDHLRGVMFLIDDNVLPSNEGRGYVLRRIIRRACFSGLNLNLITPFLYKIVDVPIKIMEKSYPSLSKSLKIIEKVIFEEEEKFQLIINSAKKIFNDFIREISGKSIPGEIVFKLYDTYGIPRDVLEELALAQNLIIDWTGFEKFLTKQKKQSRFMSGFSAQKDEVFKKKGLKETEFVGYNTLSVKCEIEALYVDKKEDVLELITDKTSFYPEKGGQIGDKGFLENEKVKIKVFNTQIDEKGFIYHIGKIEKGVISDLNSGTDVIASVDEGFRQKVSKNHTATHLLHYALREVIGKEIKQAGSYVGGDKLRFDFVCFTDIFPDLLKLVENLVQEKIFEDSKIKIEETTLEKALNKGAIALFMERYGEEVRLIQTGNYHAEVCGGTHLKNTGEISLFKIVNFTTIGKNLKRIEALTFKEALRHMNHLQNTLEEMSKEFEVSPDKIKHKIDKLKNELEEKNNTLKKYENLLIHKITDDLISKALKFTVDGKESFFIGKKIDFNNSESVGKIADMLIDRLKRAVVVIGSEVKNKLFLVIKVTEDISSQFPADKIMKEISSLIKGGGGGSALFAQGSGKYVEGFEQVLQRIVRNILEIK